MQTIQDLEEPSRQEFETGAANDQPITEASQHPEWFQQQKKPLTPDRAWNKNLLATHGSIPPWISDLAKQAESRSSFDEPMDTPMDFSAFLMNRIKIIKEQVKEQVKVQVSKILSKIEKTVNEQLEAKVLTRLSNSSKTSYAMAVDLYELELKKILIKKMKSNKSIHRYDEQRNLYKALVDAYECDKIILEIYGDTVTLKRRRDDADKDEEPSPGSD
nr:hypothetical protein [Tanacetum cinerariifolium]